MVGHLWRNQGLLLGALSQVGADASCGRGPGCLVAVGRRQLPHDREVVGAPQTGTHRMEQQ